MIDPNSKIAEWYGESYILNNYNKYNMRTVCIKEIGAVGCKKKQKNVQRLYNQTYKNLFPNKYRVFFGKQTLYKKLNNFLESIMVSN